MAPGMIAVVGGTSVTPAPSPGSPLPGTVSPDVVVRAVNRYESKVLAPLNRPAQAYSVNCAPSEVM